MPLLNTSMEPSTTEQTFTVNSGHWIRPVMNRVDKRIRSRAMITEHRLLSAKSFIEEHACVVLTLKRIAASAFMSEFHFNRLFKERFDTTPYHYYLQKKTEKAAELLLNTDLRMTQIADQTGFQDIYSFSRAFKRSYGTSPTAFQRMYRKEGTRNQVVA